MDRQVVVRFDDDTYDALQRYADDTERTLSQTIRYAVKQLIPPSSFHAVVEDDIAVIPLSLPVELDKPQGRTSSVQAFVAQYGEPDG